MEYKFDVILATDKCIKWIKEWFENNGSNCNAIVGISGGKDSTVAAALCVKALGKDRVIGVMMPNGEQADIEDSKFVCEVLGIRNYTINIASAYKSIISEIEKNNIEIQPQTKVNLPPRLRMSSLYAVSQSNNGRVVNTCNMSEDYVGYSTRYGDSAGDFAPLANFTVTEVLEIGSYLGLPDKLVKKAPSDGLTGKTDEDNLGFTYAELDRYIRTCEIDNEEHKEKIDRLHKQNLFKLKLMPSFDPGIKTKDDAAMHKAYGLGIIVGRFQTLQKGHEYMINMARALCDKVLVFVGSSQESGTEKNPFSYELRKELLITIFGDSIIIAPLADIGVGNNGHWGDYVIENAVSVTGRKPDLLISGKEERRRNWFDGIEGVNISELYIPKSIDISASEIRQFFLNNDKENWKKFVSKKLWPRYDELRKIVLECKDISDTKSI